MTTIWKFPLEVTDEQDVSMPGGSVILCAQTQSDIPCLWAMVDSEQDMESRHIVIFGTGQPIPKGLTVNYIGTFQRFGGQLIFHVFEREDK